MPPADLRHPRIESAATHWALRLTELMNNGELDEVAEMYALDVVAVDRRSVVSAPTLQGRAAIRENLEALREVGLDRVRSQVLAIRGDRLVLQRIFFSTADGREMISLGLNEWDNGEVVRRVVFDEDALDDAFAELDDRYYAGEGAEHAPLLRVGAQFIAAAFAGAVPPPPSVAAILAPNLSGPDAITAVAMTADDLVLYFSTTLANFPAALVAQPIVIVRDPPRMVPKPQAAVVGIENEKWLERPLACVVPTDPSITEDELREHLLAQGFIRLWIPDTFLFVPEVPKTSIGKFDKKAIRGVIADEGLELARTKLGATGS
jgi:hypothetical protein